LAAEAPFVPPATKDPTEGYTSLQRAKYHASMAMKAMAEHAGGDWTFAVDTEAEFILIRKIPESAPPAPDPKARFEAAGKEFKAAAIAMDPTILTMMVSWDEGDEPGAFTRLSGVYFSRSKKMADMVDATNRKHGRV
jgi:hypothetical protein